MFNAYTFIKILLILITLCWIPSVHASSNNIPLEELPEAVVKGAEAAVQGISFKEAERRQSKGAVVYELEGYADNIEYTLLVDEQGTVINVKKDD